MDALAVLANLLGGLVAELLVSGAPIQAPPPPPCATEYVRAMPSGAWVCPPPVRPTDEPTGLSD